MVIVQGFIKKAIADGIPWMQDKSITCTQLLQKSGILESSFVGWDILASVRCIVLLPWDLQLTAFAELYALGTPLVLPTADYFVAYCNRALRAVPINFWA